MVRNSLLSINDGRCRHRSQPPPLVVKSENFHFPRPDYSPPFTSKPRIEDKFLRFYELRFARLMSDRQISTPIEYHSCGRRPWPWRIPCQTVRPTISQAGLPSGHRSYPSGCFSIKGLREPVAGLRFRLFDKRLPMKLVAIPTCGYT